MNKRQKDELQYLLAIRKNTIVESDIYLIQSLLKELARRLLLWSQLIRNENPGLELGHNILFDVAFAITGNRIELPKLQDIVLSYFDKLILASYFNWKEEEQKIKNKGYELNNPYIPYIEIFKLGGHFLKFEYTRLEVYPFIGINVHPKENFLVHTPFWVDGSNM